MISILANKFETGFGTGGHRKRAEEALGRKFDYVIRSDEKTAGEARDRGVPLRQLKSRSVIVKDVSEMAEALKKSFEHSEKAAAADKA